jgi:hypothetical protein
MKKLLLLASGLLIGLVIGIALIITVVFIGEKSIHNHLYLS